MNTAKLYKTYLLTISCLAILFVISSCEEDILDVPVNPHRLTDTIGGENTRIYWEGVFENAEEFDAFACGQLHIPAAPEHNDEPQITDGPTTSSLDGVNCTSTDYQWQLGVQQAFLYDPTSDVFFIGSAIDGTSIQTGAYQPIVAPLAPITGSISLENIGGSPTFYVKNPTLSSVREKVAEMLANLAPTSTAANLSITIERINSQEQTAVAVRGNFRGFGARVNASYDWNNTAVKSRFLVNFLQVYYTLDVDITRTHPSEFFDVEELPSIDDFNGGMPVYVSSVKYGRQVVLAVESSFEAEEVRAAIQASYNGLVAGGSINVSSQHRSVLEQSSISAFVVGGNGQVASENVGGVSTLGNILTTGGNYSAESPGAPLAYTLRYLCDNSIAQIALASEYTVQECVEVGEELTLNPTDIAEVLDTCPIRENGDNTFGGNGVRISGSIRLEVAGGGSELRAIIDILFDEAIPDGPNDTRARISEDIVAYRLEDPDKYIDAVVGQDEVFIDYIPAAGTDDNFHPLFSGEFIEDIIMQADGGGDDLPCVGYTEDDDKRAHARFFFGSVRVNVKNR